MKQPAQPPITKSMELTIIEKATELFDIIEGLPSGPKRSESLLNLQRLVAQFDPQAALTLRGRISNSPSGKSAKFGGGIKTEGGSRFNTTPPAQVFANPTSATTTSDGAAVVANEQDAPEPEETADSETQQDAVAVEGQVESIYAKIAQMSAEQIVTTYGESAIEGMIVKLGRNIKASKPTVQKATFLLNLVRQKLGNTEMAADETA